MPTLPVFLAGPAMSVHAIMRFPGDMAKASAYASWRISMTMGDEPDGSALTAKIRYEAAQFAPWHQERLESEYAGSQAGKVVTALLGLLIENRKTASLDQAVKAVAAYGAAQRARTAAEAAGKRALAPAQKAVSEASLRKSLGEFAPVLHLWGAWGIRGARLVAYPSAGYSYEDDFEMFLDESEAILEALKKWDGEKKTRSVYLKADFFQVGEDWRPPVRRRGWPITGAVHKFTLDRERLPTWDAPKKRGRKPGITL
jgi:hypothetical protein